MESTAGNPRDLTSTIHLNTLRSIPGPSAEIFESLDLETREMLAKLPSGDAMLISLNGPGKGARYLLDQSEISIGRSPASDIFLDDITVSRKHALIRRNGGNFELVDEGSLNGSYLNGQLVQSAKLAIGDEIQIGKFRVNFFIGGRK